MGNAMRIKLLIILIFWTSTQGSCQVTSGEVIDTIRFSGEIIFIDSLCNMQSHDFDHWGTFQPYYLILVDVDSVLQGHDLGHRLVIRCESVEFINIGFPTNFTVQRTTSEEPNLPLQNGVLNMNYAADSLFKQIDKSSFVLSFINKIDCMDYSLKEKLYLTYRLIED